MLTNQKRPRERQSLSKLFQVRIYYYFVAARPAGEAEGGTGKDKRRSRNEVVEVVRRVDAGGDKKLVAGGVCLRMVKEKI